MLIIARHGESLISSGVLVHSNGDEDKLTDRGLLQARKLGEYLLTVSSSVCLHASPANRTVLTSTEVSRFVNVLRFELDDRLAEFGDVERLSSDLVGGNDVEWGAYRHDVSARATYLLEHSVGQACVVVGHAGWAAASGLGPLSERMLLGHGDCWLVQGTATYYWRNPV